MLRAQFIFIFVAIGAIYLLYSLPRVVIDNKKKAVSLTADIVKNHVHQNNDLENQEKKDVIARLKKSLVLGEREEIALDTLDKLITILKSINQYDSAAIHAAHLAKKYPKESNYLKVGDLFHQSYLLTTDPQKAIDLVEQARKYFEKAYMLNPKPDTKVKLAMTYVSSSNPMQGISMIREVLKEDPDNELAIFNLGVLSLRSGQYQKAKNRFDQLLVLNPDNLQALFYLGFSLKSLNKTKEAIEILTKVQRQDKDPDISIAATQLINEIQQ